MSLRFAIHGHILRLSMPIADMGDRSGKITEMQDRLDEEGDQISETARDAIESRTSA